nr:zinc finger, CCHC-type [Tanacetum cinerariifolium]
MVEGDKRDDTSSSAALREQGNVLLQCLKLTETNYTTWALIMETILKAYGIWETILAKEGETTNEKKDNTSMEIIFQTLPQDMLMQVAQYTTAKKGGRGHGRNFTKNKSSYGKGTSHESIDKSKLWCYECGEHGHFAKECMKWNDKKKDKEQEALLISDDEGPTLM